MLCLRYHGTITAWNKSWRVKDAVERSKTTFCQCCNGWWILHIVDS